MHWIPFLALGSGSDPEFLLNSMLIARRGSIVRQLGERLILIFSANGGTRMITRVPPFSSESPGHWLFVKSNFTSTLFNRLHSGNSGISPRSLESLADPRHLPLWESFSHSRQVSDARGVAYLVLAKLDSFFFFSDSHTHTHTPTKQEKCNWENLSRTGLISAKKKLERQRT